MTKKYLTPDPSAHDFQRQQDMGRQQQGYPSTPTTPSDSGQTLPHQQPLTSPTSFTPPASPTPPTPQSSGKRIDRVRKPPVDKKRAALYIIFACGIVILFLPLMVIIHELGHAAAVIALGGEVEGIEFDELGGSVTFSGIEDDQDLLIVHLSGVLANVLVGGYLLFHVWKFKGHPFQEALTLIWGLVLFLTDLIAYSIGDIFYDHGGDFDKIYDTYEWSKAGFILLDLVFIIFILIVLSKDKFWAGIQLPRKKR